MNALGADSYNVSPRSWTCVPSYSGPRQLNAVPKLPMKMLISKARVAHFELFYAFMPSLCFVYPHFSLCLFLPTFWCPVRAVKYSVAHKNIHFCFLAQLLENLSNLNRNLSQYIWIKRWFYPSKSRLCLLNILC